MQDITRISLSSIESAGRGCRVVSWDGRLDNADDIRLRLGSIACGADSSEALIALAVEQDGLPALGRLVGDWSVVVHDQTNAMLILASDYAGVRPLYYARGPHDVRCSTRLDSLVASSDADALDETYAAAFLSTGGCSDRTPYAGIAVVPPGHAVCMTSTAITTRSLWMPPTSDVIRYQDERRYDEQFRALFKEAVAVRLATDAPVLAELSGGLDSSSVVCMAAELIRARAVRAPALATITYDHATSIDTPFIQEVEAWTGVRHTHVPMARYPIVAGTSVGSARPQVWGPPHSAAAELADSLGARVFLTGQLGDLVAGNWFNDSLQVAASIRSGRIGRACSDALAWSKVTRVPVAHILLDAMRAALPVSPRSAALFSSERASTGSVDLSLSPAMLERAVVTQRGWFSREWMAAPPERRKHLHALAGMRALRTLARVEPLQRLDYTHPFAHRPLVEFLFSVPADVLCQPGEPRRLMRRALRDLWPPTLRTRRSKSLFGTPWTEALRPLALELLRSPRIEVVDRGWVDRRSFMSRLDKLVHGLDCDQAQLRHIVIFEFWLRRRAISARRNEARIA